jgi:hypothetical protein
MTTNRIETAGKMKRLLIESAPLIEDYTWEVCPACAEVCCKQKHGVFRENDIGYLHALGLEAPQRDQGRPAEGPCEWMGPRGCNRPRWLRPFKCTWFFCGPLLKAMNDGPSRKARQLSTMLQKMADLYGELGQGQVRD